MNWGETSDVEQVVPSQGCAFELETAPTDGCAVLSRACASSMSLEKRSATERSRSAMGTASV